ncbi:YhfT family protein [Shigella flexneri]
MFTLEKAYSAGVTPEQWQTLIDQAALAEFMRGLGFVPIWICHHRVSHRRICSCGLAFLYAVGYLRRIRWLSGIRRSGYTAEVCCFVRSANGWDATRECVMRRDNMVNAMNMLMEVALLVGSIFAANQVAGYTGLIAGPFTSSTNPSAVPGTENGGAGSGSNDHRYLLNVLYWLGLFVPTEGRHL